MKLNLPPEPAPPVRAPRQAAGPTPPAAHGSDQGRARTQPPPGPVGPTEAEIVAFDAANVGDRWDGAD
jgi:hypothetical protein